MTAVDESFHDAWIMDRDGYPYVIHPLMDGVPRVDPELLREFVAWAKEQPGMDQATVLLAPEAMGIPLAVALSLETDIPYLVARKRQYGLDGETIAYCETGYGQSCVYLNDIRPDDRIVIVDDVVSTGGTLAALLDTLEGMKATVVGVVAAVDKGGAESLAARDVPVHAMRRLHVEGATIRLD